MNHPEEAKLLFYAGYNCSQAIFCAFRDVTGLDLDTAARMSSPLGGGVGRLREVCGAFSGAILVLGAVEGYSDPSAQEEKRQLYARVQEYARRFRERNGSIICRELLKDVKTSEGGAPERRTPEFYTSRPCLRIIEEAASILEEMLQENTSLNREV